MTNLQEDSKAPSLCTLRLPSAHRVYVLQQPSKSPNPEQPECFTSAKPVQAHHIIFSKNKVSDMKTAVLHGAFSFSSFCLLFKICVQVPHKTIHCSKTINRDLVFQCLLVCGYINFYSFWGPLSDINFRTELSMRIKPTSCYRI